MVWWGLRVGHTQLGASGSLKTMGAAVHNDALGLERFFESDSRF
jgi:hypothetical protein